MNVFVTTQMRSGSTWLCDIISDLLSVRWEFWKKGNTIHPNRFKQQIKSRGRNKLIKIHWALPVDICKHIPENDKNNFVMSITRDIKDIAVSMAMYTRYDKVVGNSLRLKPIDDVRKKLNTKLNDKQYINAFIDTKYFENNLMHYWKLYNNGYIHPNYFLISYEQLMNRPMITLKQITEFLGIPRNAKQIKSLLQKNSFIKKTRRKPGSGNNKPFRRKGIVGDWQNYLTKKSLDRIDKLLETRSMWNPNV